MEIKSIKVKPIKEINTDDLRTEIYKDGRVVFYGTIYRGFVGAIEISKEDMKLIIKEYSNLNKKINEKEIESIDYLLLEIDNIARRLDFTNYHGIEKRIEEIKGILKGK